MNTTTTYGAATLTPTAAADSFPGNADYAAGGIAQRPLRVGHDCAGMEAPTQALRNLGVAFTSAFASDISVARTAGRGF